MIFSPPSPLLFCCSFWGSRLLCIPCCPGTCSVDYLGLKLNPSVYVLLNTGIKQWFSAFLILRSLIQFLMLWWLQKNYCCHFITVNIWYSWYLINDTPCPVAVTNRLRTTGLKACTTLPGSSLAFTVWLCSPGCPGMWHHHALTTPVSWRPKL